ncbi:MAG: hypothetical protein U5L72_09465 [Bacteroidales bacterium]|nr:hypothetical protein [Bacteroidales bacterium]
MGELHVTVETQLAVGNSGIVTENKRGGPTCGWQPGRSQESEIPASL